MGVWACERAPRVRVRASVYVCVSDSICERARESQSHLLYMPHEIRSASFCCTISSNETSTPSTSASARNTSTRWMFWGVSACVHTHTQTKTASTHTHTYLERSVVQCLFGVIQGRQLRKNVLHNIEAAVVCVSTRVCRLCAGIISVWCTENIPSNKLV